MIAESSAPLKYYGGKSYLAKLIISIMPPHVHYVEPFAGGLAVLLAKDYGDVSEVVNDINGDLMNFWRVLASPTLFDDFRRILQATPFSQELFRNAKNPKDGENAVERAVRFFIRCRQSRQGSFKDFATLTKTRTRRRINEQASSWLSAIDGLAEAHDRLLGVVILNDDAMKIIKREDWPTTLFYLDPPYSHKTRVTTSDYACEMTEADHSRLLSVLEGIEGKFILSGYRNNMYDDAATKNGWHRVDRPIDCKASGKKKKPKRIECLWMNFKPQGVVSVQC